MVMKKYLMGLFFLGVLLLAGCSKDNEPNEGEDDGGKEVENEFKITPPSWLIGTWGDDYGMVEVKYSKDNVALKYMQVGVELHANDRKFINMHSSRHNRSSSQKTQS